MTDLTAAIKEELDRECAVIQLPISDKADGWCEKKRDKRLVPGFDCWRCGKHDALAARIADRIEGERT